MYGMQLADLVLAFLINLLGQPHLSVLPLSFIIFASWRVARMRPTAAHYEQEVTEKVSDAIKERIAEDFLRPLLNEHHIYLPHNRHVIDVINLMVPGDGDLELLSSIFLSLDEFGVGSPFFAQAQNLIVQFF
jgi:hypothetical protein